MKEERDPPPLSSVRFYAENRPPNYSIITFWRNLTVVILGIRCIRRPSELCYIPMGDVFFKESTLMVRIPKSKTDQLSRGFFDCYRSSDRLGYVPVKVIVKWMEIVGFLIAEERF